MPPSDQEPRYQLVDSNGNVVGSLFGDGSGNVVIADETDTQTTFDADGITTPALEAGKQTLTGPRNETQEIVAFDSDNDNSNGLTLTIGAIPDIEKGRLVVIIEGAGDGLNSPVNIQVNNVTSAYSQTTINEDTLSTSTANSKWSYDMYERNTDENEFILTANGEPINCKQITGGPRGGDKIYQAEVGTTSPLSSVTITTSFNASGRAYVKSVFDS